MRRDRNEVIDGFRGVAILAVLAFHYLVRWAPPAHGVNLYGYKGAFPSWLQIGSYGVHLFFVISGMVIAMTVLRSGSVRDFAVRRFARLWPALVVAATATWAVIGLAGPPEFHRSPADYVASLTFLAADLRHQPIDGAYWSLAVEVKFYAITAAAFLVLRQRFWIGMAAVGLVSGLAAITGHGDKLLFAIYWPYFLAGMAGWYWLFERRAGIAALLGGEAAVLFAISNPGLVPSATLLVAVIAMFGLIRLGAPAPVLAPLGRISYSLYLLHQELGVIVIRALTDRGCPDLAACLITAAGMIALAWASWRFVETPGAKLIRRLAAAARQQGQPQPPIAHHGEGRQQDIAGGPGYG